MFKKINPRKINTQTRPPYVKIYNSWRIRILYSIIIGYATFYICRQNFNIAMPSLMDQFGVTKTQLGWVLTAASIVYGVGKFVNGFISDRSDARIFIVCGLVIVSILTILSGFATSITSLGILWILNNWFQSMGWPPIARMLTHWFTAKELGTKWAIGAASHQLGGAITMVVCGYLVEYYNWQVAFFIPGFVALLVSVFLFNRLRNAPDSVGLPAVEEYKGDYLNISDTNHNLSINQLLRLVFANKLMWCVCFSNMSLYIVRLGIIFWAPIFLRELKNITLAQAGLEIAAYEIFGLIGGISAGWISDKMFFGRRGFVGVLFMLGLGLTLLLFWKIPSEYELISICAMTFAGFFVYGPQVLIGVACADFTTKLAIGTANGFASIFAYLGSALAGVCVGWIVDNWGWDGVFVFFISSALCGAIAFSFTCNYKRI